MTASRLTAELRPNLQWSLLSRASKLITLPRTLPLTLPRSLQATSGLFSRAWAWVRARQIAQSSPRRLRVAETVSLGEKRFVAVIQVDGLQFLVGGGATNVTLLAQLHAKVEFGDVLKQASDIPAAIAGQEALPGLYRKQEPGETLSQQAPFSSLQPAASSQPTASSQAAALLAGEQL